MSTEAWQSFRKHRDMDWMWTENKCVILWLELHAEILLDKLTNDVFLLWTLTKTRLSLGPNFSCSPWVKSCGISPGHQTHNSFLPCSHSSIMGPCNAWFQRDLAGLHHRCRWFDSVLQPLVSGCAFSAALCVPPWDSCVPLWKGRQGHEEQWVVHPVCQPTGDVSDTEGHLKGTKTYFWAAESCPRCFTQQ